MCAWSLAIALLTYAMRAVPCLLRLIDVTHCLGVSHAANRYFLGRLGDHEVVFLPRHGRGHRYTPSEVNYRANVFGLKMLHCKWVIGVSAVGSLQEEVCALTTHSLAQRLCSFIFFPSTKRPLLPPTALFFPREDGPHVLTVPRPFSHCSVLDWNGAPDLG